MKYEDYEKIFKKYINKNSLDMEYINNDDWDCSIMFDLNMLDELGIKYNSSLQFDNYIKTINHSNNEPFVFYVSDNRIWLWAIILKPFKRNRKRVGSYYIADSESAGNLQRAYPSISRALKRYLTPLLDDAVSQLNIFED